MTVFYVDPEGEAGDGTGSSFANRASGMDSANSTIRSSYAAGDEIRVKKSPDPTSLGTCIVSDKNMDSSYYVSSISLGSFSTTAGESTFNKSNHRLVTGDFIYISNETNLSTHRINGLWKVTVVSTSQFKLDGYVGPSSGSISGAKYKIMSSNVFELNTSNITKLLVGGNDSDYSGNVVPSWTVNGSNCTYTQVNGNSNSAWSSNLDVLYPPVSHKFVVDGDATAGTKLAHFQLDASTDLSAYQQISVLWRQANGSPEKGGNIKLCLCSDTSGDTVVDSTDAFDVTTNNQNNWATGYVPITYKGDGAALGSNIQSIALYVDTQDANTQDCTYYLSSVIASKSTSSNDCLTYNSVVGLQTTADPYWYSVGWIRDNYILLQICNNPNRRWYSSYYTGWGYFRGAASNSATLYVRQPMYLGDLRETNATQGLNTGIIYFNSNTNGTSSNPINVSGGWDTTAMSSQTGETFIDGQLYDNYLVRVQSTEYVSVSKITAIRFYYGHYFSSAEYLSITDAYNLECYSNNYYIAYCDNILKLKLHATGCIQGYNIYLNRAKQSSSANRADFILKATGSSHQYANIQSQSNSDLTLEEVDVRGSSNVGLNLLSGSNFYIHTFYGGYVGDTGSASSGADFFTQSSAKVTINTSYHGKHAQSGYAFDDSGGSTINKIIHTVWLNGDGSVDTNKSCGNVSGTFARCGSSGDYTVIGVDGDSECYGQMSFQNGGKVRTHDLTFTHSGTLYSTSNAGSIEVSDYDGTAGDIRTLYPNSSVIKETTTTQPGSGTAWKQELSSALGTTSTTPEEFPIGKIAVNGGSQVTVSVYVRRTATSIFPGLHVKANGLIGVSATSAYITAAADTWQQISANFTPTGAGIIEITLGAYRAGVGDAFYDTFSATQA
mgnify:FL=1